ncbi:MAG: NAD(P)/FAD-dependent oxidoreductase [Candidatus Bathyarchaeia archaeon]
MPEITPNFHIVKTRFSGDLMIYDTVIVGGGPAGVAAAIQLFRSGFEILLLEKNQIGGLMLNASLVENYPGFPLGIRGKELAELFRKHLKKTRIRHELGEVKEIERRQEIYAVRARQQQVECRTLIIATGTLPKKLMVPGEGKLIGSRLFYEIEDLPFLGKEKIVTVIGSGDIAFDYALNVANNGINASLVMRGERQKCMFSLFRSAVEHSKIKIFKNTLVNELLNEGNKIVLKGDSNEKLLSTDFVLVAVGREPNLGFLPAKWQRLLVMNSDALEHVGVFLAGDVNPHNFRHVGIAVGDGLAAAMKVARFLA